MAVAKNPDNEELAQLAQAVHFRWTLNARPEQLSPDDYWRIWFILTGRGWGKTRTAAETVRGWMESGKYSRVHLVAPTAADVRDTMVEGKSGLLNVCPPWNRPLYEPSKRRLTWPNGAMAVLFSAEEPERLRGPECEAWWADELAAWKYQEETWHNLQMGARLGDPKGIITTTPKPQKLIKELLQRAHTHITRGSTFDNAANLSAAFIEEIRERYEGTRRGMQEIEGRVLVDNPNALWQLANIEAHRIKLEKLPQLVRIVVALDPTATSDGDAAGIVAAGKGVDGEFYVLDDKTRQGSPAEWAKATVDLFKELEADRIVYESNQGGEMVAHTLRTVDRGVPLRSVHAYRGKALRAEPIAALYEQGRVHHVGTFAELEEEMCEWVPGDSESPNRMDALVYALLELSKRGDRKKARSH